MFDTYFLRMYDMVRTKKALVFGAAVLLVCAAGVGVFFLEFDSNVDLMLPDDSNIKRSISFFRESDLSNKIIVSLGINAKEKTKEDLFRAADQLTASLSPPLFTETASGFSGLNIIDEVMSASHISQTVSEKELSRIDGEINRESIARKLRGMYLQLLKPESIFITSSLSSDPLGLRLFLLEKLNAQAAFMGYDVDIEDGHFISRDGRHTMVMTQTPVKMTDSAGSRELLSALDEKIGRLPEYISADVVSGFLHSASNEKVIRQDIRLAVSIATIGFLVLFLVFFRDFRVFYIFLIPLAAVLIAINLSSLLMGSLSFWVIGLGTVIAGIAVDYGIHVYVAIRSSGRQVSVLKDIAKPVCMGALTTLGIFIVFLFSRTEGYHQLAVLSVLSISLSLFSALFILPHVLIKRNFPFGYKEAAVRKVQTPGGGGKMLAAVWASSLVAAVFFTWNVSFDSDIKQLDGSEPSVQEAENNFHRVWGEEDSHAFFIVSHENYEDALALNDLIYRDAVSAIGEEHFLSLSAVWPSQKTRQEKAARWREFWRQGREEKLRTLFKEEGARYQFSETAFSRFFDNLYADAPGPRESRYQDTPQVFRDRFVQKREDGYQILSYFPDEDRYIDALTGISRRYPGTFQVSHRLLSRSISSATSSESGRLAIIAAFFIIFLTFLFLQNVKRALMALVPVITGVMWLLGFIYVTGLTLNIANIFAGIVVMGLCIDYGIFMTYNYKHNLKKSAIIAISISAGTTLIGAGVLLFADHPALFSSGITLFVGILAGYISAVIIVPSLENIFAAPREK